MTRCTTRRMARRQNTSEDLVDDLSHLTMTRITTDQITAHSMITRTANIIDHRRPMNLSPATVLIAILHPTMNMVPASIVNTALLHHYHLVISTSHTLLHLIRNVHTEGQDGLGNLTGMIHRGVITMIDLNIMALLHLSITIIVVLPLHSTTNITKIHPSTTGYHPHTLITLAHLNQSVIHTRTILDSSNYAQKARTAPRNVKISSLSSPPHLPATKKSATCTPTARCTIFISSTSMGSPPEKHPTAHSTPKISSY